MSRSAKKIGITNTISIGNDGFGSLGRYHPVI